MARIRTIKPEFWTSEQVVECSPIARLMFIGMWNFADDAGRLVNSPKRIKMSIFPGDEISSENILGMIKELASNGLVKLYAVDGVDYIQVTGWRHQRIDKPQKSQIPPPGAEGPSTIPGTFVESSATEGNGREGNGRERDSSFQQQQQHSEPRAPAAQEAAPPPAAAEQFDPKAADDLMARLRAAAGYEHNPAPGLFVIGPIQALMTEGFDLDREILPVIRAKAMTMTRPAQSWAYFVPMIREQRDKANSSSGTRGKSSGEARTALMSEIDRREKQRGHIAEALAKSGVDPATELGCRKIVAGFAAEQWFEVFREGQPFSPALLPLDMAWLKQHLSDTNVLMSLAYHQRPEFGRLRALAEMSGATIPASFRELASMLEDTIEENGPPADYLGLMAQAPRHGMPAPPTSEAA